MSKGMDLRLKRVSLDIKAIDLSRVVGISNSKLSLIEKGYLECPLDLYNKIIFYLDSQETLKKEVDVKDE